MKFDFSKYDTIYVFASRIGEDLHEYAKTATSEEFANTIDELVNLSREEGRYYEFEREKNDYDFVCEDDE